MDFPTINAQQELNNRKIIEELQFKKRLILQKGLMQVPAIGLSQQQQPPTQAHEIPISSQGNNLGLGRAAWAQANSQSFGFFIAQDSMFGNNILPVLPRPTPNPSKKQ